MSDPFSGLKTDVPATLLPIRLEAKFDGERLRLRMIPDAVHAFSHQEQLTTSEIEVGQTYWSALWEQKDGDDTLRTLERKSLASLVGTQRAVHVTNKTRPTNWEKWDRGDGPKFPELTGVEQITPPLAHLLPDFWQIRIFDDTMTEIIKERCKNDIAPDLAMAPVLGATEQAKPEELKDADELDLFLADQNVRWLVDFKRAKAVGMAYEVKLPKAYSKLGAVLVAGIRRAGNSVVQAEEFEKVLRGHWYSAGLDVLPQGTATNHSDESSPPPTEEAEDVDRLFALDVAKRTGAIAIRAAVLRTTPQSLTILPAADQLSLAFGTILGNRFDHTDHANLNQGLEAAALGTIATQGLGQYYTTRVASHLGGQAPFANDWTYVSDHQLSWVRAAGPLPSIRIGNQPYGVLPIQGRLSSERASQKGDDALITTILALFPRWASAERPATLDPDATDGRPAQSPNATITALLEVLGHVPSLRNLVVRSLFNDVIEDANAIAQALQYLKNLFNRAGVQTGIGWEERLESLRVQMTGTGIPVDTRIAIAPSLATQFDLIAELEFFIQGDPTAPLSGGNISPQYVNEALGHVKTIEDILNTYQEGLDGLPDLIRPFFEEGGVSLAPPAVNKPEGLANFAASVYGADTTPIENLTLFEGSLEPLGRTLGTILDKIAEADSKTPRDSFTDPSDPLLAHMVDLAWRFVPIGEIQGVKTAIQLLAARVEILGDMAEDDPNRSAGIADLDRLTRDALGPLSYRLDAWITSFATRRLALLRSENPYGTTLGGYGWLLDLAPAAGHVSDGYIHAPSTNQAVTAALLHSGWKAYGTGNETAPLAVDLTSDRVRGAEWILDGMRNGQNLGDILGARLERSLHDDPQPLDSYIDDIRSATNANKGLSQPAARIVDGLLVARAYSTEPTTEELFLRTALENLTAPANNSTAKNRRNLRVRELFAQIAANLDAVADLTMAQSVHSLSQGHDTSAGAVLNMLGDQEGPVPTIDVMRTPRHGQLVTHRLGVLCPETTDPNARVLTLAEPRLAAWYATHLPDLNDVGFIISVSQDNKKIQSKRHKLSQLGLGTSDLVALAGRQETQATTALGRMITAWAIQTYQGQTVAMHTSKASGRLMSTDEFGLLAVAAADAVSAARPLQPKDLVPAGSEETFAPYDTAELSYRRQGLDTALTQYLAELETSKGDTLWATVRDLVVLRIAPALDFAANLNDDPKRQLTIDALTARIAAVQAAETDEEALRAGTNGAIRILPPVALSNAAPLRPAPAKVQTSDLTKDNGIWWSQVGKVSEKVGAMELFLDLAHALNGKATPPAIRQLPTSNDSWAAMNRPSGTEDCTTFYWATGAAELDEGGSVAGLICDTLVDTVPAEERATGIAWHFDAPSARPPQVILLSMLDEKGKNLDDQIFHQLLNTLELMKLRAQGADRIYGLGQIAPALYFPDQPYAKVSK